MTILFRPLHSLSVHPALDAIDLPGEDDPESRAVVESVCARGIIEPLKVVGNAIVDGRLRRRGALAAAMEEVPVIEVSEDDIFSVIVDSLLARRHITKSYRAYLVSPLIADRLAESGRRRIQNLRNQPTGEREQPGQPKSSRAGTLARADTAEKIAEALGLSPRYVKYAAQIHREFSKSRELRDHFQPKLHSGELNLAAVVQGIAGWKSTTGKQRLLQPELDLWETKMRALLDPRKFATWGKASQETQRFITEKIAEAVGDYWPAEIVEAVFARIKERKRKAPRA